MKNLSEFKPLIKLLGKDKNRLILASIIIFINGLGDTLTGYLNGMAVSEITNLNIRGSLMYLGIYFFLEITLNGILIHYANSILYKIESAVTRKLGFNSYVKALNLPAYAYEKFSSGEVINRITNDADTLSFAFGRILKIFSSLVGSGIIIIYVFINSWIIGIEIIILVFILFIVINYYNPKLKQIHKERKSEQDKFTSLTTETIRGIREIKTLGIKDNLINNIMDIIKVIFDKSKTEIDIEKRFNIIIGFLKAVLEVGVFVTCVILLYYEKTNLSFFVAMTYYVYKYMWLVENISELSKTFQKTIVSISRVNELIENRLYKDEKFGMIELKECKGIIEFNNVTFSYPNEDSILNDFSVKLEPNKKIAIVGKSGQGKSTLFNLITRIFDTEKGYITLDGVNILELKEESLRKHISIIRQEPFIFNRTIKENFELIDKNIKLKDIKKYCKMAYIDKYIESLPMKYDTILGEGGVNLSGGQKQRLSIARTLSKKSRVILFDEATSALDNESQEYVKRAIDDLVCDHTVVIVAHRLSTIMNADIIYVVDKGKVVAYGTHQELLKNNETYKNLYNIETLNS